MVPKQTQSKRRTCRHKYKVKRKVAEHNRKLRKESKKNGGSHKRLKKDPGIPNLWPFKERLLDQIEETKRKAEEDKQRQKGNHADQSTKNRNQSQLQDITSGATMLDLVKSASKRSKQFDRDRDEEMDETAEMNGNVRDAALSTKDNSRKAYYKEFRKVIEKADVLLEVLDARDPAGTRAKHIEAIIREAGAAKKIVLVLNKIDLVPKEIVEGWLTYLRGELPTVAFKASTQQQRKNLGHSKVDVQRASEAMLNSAECLGADTLINILKNYSRNLNLKTSITVGVIGYPNVGKSSLINSLKRAKVCNVGATPGVTKATQEVALDKNLRLIDCPGIVFSAPSKKPQGWQEAAEVMLRNCIKVELLDDPITPVELILTRASKPTLMLLYNIPTFSSPQEFLSHIARAKGKLKRGGIPDLDGAARSVLQDWSSGKIPFYTVAPKRDLSGGVAIVSEFTKEFDLADVDAELNSLKSAKEMSVDFVALRAVQPMEEDEAFADAGSISSDESMDEDNDENSDMEDMDVVSSSNDGAVIVPEQTTKSKQGTSVNKKQQILTVEEEEINPQSNKRRAKMVKQAKKFEKKIEGKMSNNVKKWVHSDDVEMDVSGEEGDEDDYDFGEFGLGSVPQ